MLSVFASSAVFPRGFVTHTNHASKGGLGTENKNEFRSMPYGGARTTILLYLAEVRGHRSKVTVPRAPLYA